MALFKVLNVILETSASQMLMFSHKEYGKYIYIYIYLNCPRNNCLRTSLCLSVTVSSSYIGETMFNGA